MMNKAGRVARTWCRLATAIAWTALAWTIACIGAERCEAQELWEFSPYRVRVWVAPGPHAMLTPALREEIARTFTQRAELTFGAAWEVTTEAPPSDFAVEAAVRLDSLSVAQLVDRAKLAPPKKTKRPAESAGASAAAGEGTGAASGSEPAGQGATPGSGAVTGEASEAKPPGEAKPDAANTPPASAAGEPGVVLNPETPAAEGAKPEPPKLDPLTQSLRELFQEDKLFVISVLPSGGDWLLRCRELDCRSRAWGEIQERRVGDLGLVPSTAWDLVRATFRPVARLESAKDKEALWRIRAGGLVVRDDSPLLPAPDSMWRPYVRLNDRVGEPRMGVVPPIPWTIGVAKGREGTLLKTEIHTGVRNTLTARTTSRTQRFALQVRPTGKTTLLTLRSTDKNVETMSGYDVLVKDPRSEETAPLGRTDWRGTMTVPATDYPLRVVYLKNGSQLLARLPLIPGLEATMIADLNADDRRLQVEGYNAGLQGKIMDLVARRAIMASRVKKRANEGKIDEAVKLLEEYKALPTKEELTRQIDLAQVKLTSPNKRTQDKIDKMFNDSRKLLDKFVTSKQLRELEAELGVQAGASASLGGGRGPAPPAPAPAPKAGDGRAAGAPPPQPTTPPGVPGAPPMGVPMGVPGVPMPR